MATMFIPGHDRDAIEHDVAEYEPTEQDLQLVSRFLQLTPDLDVPEPATWLVECQGCGQEYTHIEGVHDGYCDRCEQAYTADVTAELDELAYDEWAAAERDCAQVG